MKVNIFSDKNKSDIRDLLGDEVEISENNPDVVIVKGGDGMLMKSEAAFPGIPKLLVKDSLVCKLCSDLENKEIISGFLTGNYFEEKFFKIEAEAKGKLLLGLNDIVVHNSDPRHAIRYNVNINGDIFLKEVIGDGIVVATSLGSTGYYRSITDSFFQVGIGLAFNNSTEQSDHVVLKEDAVIEIEITRGPAVVYGDNDKENIILEKGEKIRIRKSKKEARILKIKK